MSIKTLQTKALGTGKTVADEQLAKINNYALVPLTADQVHVRRYLMAHNFIDRDNERFAEALLDDFAQTLPGKGFFVEGHPSSWNGKSGPGEGRFFDASAEEMTPEAFAQITGETPKMPDNIMSVKVLWGEAYILRLDSNADTLAKIDGGIYAFTSIGFKAPYFEVTDGRGNLIHGEYRPKGEALEGSLVWLGAQPGAAAMKQNKQDSGKAGITEKGGKDDMKEFLKNLGGRLKKDLTEENAADEISAIMADKDAEITSFRSLAEEGRAYREDLADDALRFGALTGEIPADAEAQKEEKAFLTGLPLKRLKSMRDKFEKDAREKFPDQFTFKGKDETDKQKKQPEDGENPVVKDAQKRAEIKGGK